MSNNAQMLFVISKERSKAFISLLMVLLILGATNHCIFEDFFSSFSKIVFGAEGLQHLPNHLGSNTQHQHNDSSESHEHGQPHSVVAIRFEQALSDFLNPLVIISSLFLFAVCIFGVSVAVKKTKVVVPYATGDPPKVISSFISSLTLAPQAPPI